MSNAVIYSNNNAMDSSLLSASSSPSPSPATNVMIPMASPYLWPEDDNDDDNNSSSSKSSSEDDRYKNTFYQSQHLGTGFRFLQNELQSSKTLKSFESKTLLQSLLIKSDYTPNPKNSSYYDDDTITTQRIQFTAQALPTSTVEVIENDDTYTHNLELTESGQVSLFLSILRVFDTTAVTTSNTSHHNTNSGVILSTRQLMKESLFSIHPGGTPGCMDSREIFMAALHFLCQTWEAPDDDDDDVLPKLPLLYPTNITNDLERRSYLKSYDWSILPPTNAKTTKRHATFLQSILRLENDYFYDTLSTSSYPFIARDKYRPIYYSNFYQNYNDNNSNNNNDTIKRKKSYYTDSKRIRKLYLRGMLEDEPDNSNNTTNSTTTSTKKGGMKKSAATSAASKSATTSSGRETVTATNKSKKRSQSPTPTTKTNKIRLLPTSSIGKVQKLLPKIQTKLKVTTSVTKQKQKLLPLTRRVDNVSSNNDDNSSNSSSNSNSFVDGMNKNENPLAFLNKDDDSDDFGGNDMSDDDLVTSSFLQRHPTAASSSSSSISVDEDVQPVDGNDDDSDDETVSDG